MRAILQRVARAEVRVEAQCVGRIGDGYLALIGVEQGDTAADVDWLCRKIINLRLWPDMEGKMNVPLQGRSVLAVSQFTLFADCRRGNRPGFERAARPAEAKVMFEMLVAAMRGTGVAVETGIFQADMDVELVNRGPVTISLDSRAREA